MHAPPMLHRASAIERLTLPALLLLTATLIVSAFGAIDSMRQGERAQSLLRDLDRLHDAAGSGDRSRVAAARTALLAGAGLALLDRAAIAALTTDPGQPAASASSFADAIAAQRAQVQLQAAAFSHAGERRAHVVMLCTGLLAALCLAILLRARAQARADVEARLRAEAAADNSDRELRLSVQQLTDVSLGMKRLSAYASLLQSCQQTEEALDITKISLPVLMSGCAGSVYLLQAADDDDESTTEHAELAVSWGEHAVPGGNHFGPQDCWAMRRARPFASDPESTELRCAHLDPECRIDDAATLCLPISAQGISMGLMYLSGAAPIQGEPLAVTAAEQLSMALANLRMKEALHNQSIRDAMTGLYNRRYLEERLPRELSRSTRQGRPLAVVMLDIDHFKRFNDTHGHPGGDALLAAIGALLRRINRSEDVSCRYGGEEFTIIMPDTDAEAAATQCERIRAAIVALRVRHAGIPLSPVTASFGIAAHPQHAQALDALFTAADTALYRAKTDGRNRVVVATTAVAAAD